MWGGPLLQTALIFKIMPPNYVIEHYINYSSNLVFPFIEIGELQLSALTGTQRWQLWLDGPWPIRLGSHLSCLEEGVLIPAHYSCPWPSQIWP